MSEGKLSAAERIKAAEEARQALAQEHEDAYLNQKADDVEAQLELEREHGYGRIHPVEIERDAWQHGTATRLVCLLPEAKRGTCKRFLNLLNDDKAKPREKTEAGDQLGESCVVYPKVGSDEYKAMLEQYPMILQQVAIAVSRKVQGKRAEQGK